MKYIDITDILTKKGVKDIKSGEKGDILGFNYEGTQRRFKVMRKSKGRVWAKELDNDKFLTPDEADEQVMVTPNAVRK